MGKRAKRKRIEDVFDSWAPSERKIKLWLYRIKARMFYPFNLLFSTVGITPNMLSYSSIIIAFIMYLLIDKNIETAAILLLVTFILDGLDGPLARYRNDNIQKGALTDNFSDALVLVFFIMSMEKIQLMDPVVGIVFVAIYPLNLVFTIARNAIKHPPFYGFKPRPIIYIAFYIFLFSGWNWIDEITLACTVIMFALMTINFVELRKKIK